LPVVRWGFAGNMLTAWDLTTPATATGAWLLLQAFSAVRVAIALAAR